MGWGEKACSSDERQVKIFYVSRENIPHINKNISSSDRRHLLWPRIVQWRGEKILVSRRKYLLWRFSETRVEWSDILRFYLSGEILNLKANILIIIQVFSLVNGSETIIIVWSKPDLPAILPGFSWLTWAEVSPWEHSKASPSSWWRATGRDLVRGSTGPPWPGSTGTSTSVSMADTGIIIIITHHTQSELSYSYRTRPITLINDYPSKLLKFDD